MFARPRTALGLRSTDDATGSPDTASRPARPRSSNSFVPRPKSSNSTSKILSRLPPRAATAASRYLGDDDDDDDDDNDEGGLFDRANPASRRPKSAMELGLFDKSEQHRQQQDLRARRPASSIGKVSTLKFAVSLPGHIITATNSAASPLLSTYGNTTNTKGKEHVEDATAMLAAAEDRPPERQNRSGPYQHLNICRKLRKGVEAPTPLTEKDKKTLVEFAPVDKLMDERIRAGQGDFARPSNVFMPSVKPPTPRKGKTVGHHKDAEYFLNQGNLNIERRELRDSLKNFQTALSFSHHPANVDYRTMTTMGYVLHTLHEHALATKHLAVTAELIAPLNPKCHYNHGVSLLHEGEYTSAVQAFDRALKLDPKNPEIFYARAVAYRKLGKFQLSMNDYNNSKELALLQNKEEGPTSKPPRGNAHTHKYKPTSRPHDKQTHIEGIIPDLGKELVGFGEMEELNVEGEVGTDTGMWNKLTERYRDESEMQQTQSKKSSMKNIVRTKLLMKREIADPGKRFLGILKQKEHKGKMQTMWKIAITTVLAMVNASKEANTRSFKSCQQLCAWLKHTNFFGKQPSLLNLKLAQKLKVRKFVRGDLVISQGDTFAFSMFVLVFGECSVHIIKNMNPYDQVDLSKAICVATYKSKGDFGEVALHSSQPRAASVRIDSEEAILLELEKTDYDQMTKMYREEIAELKMHHLSKSRIFSSTKDTQLQLLLNHMTRRIVPRGSVVITQGAHLSKIFLVMSGQCALFRDPNKTLPPPYPDEDFGTSLTPERDDVALAHLLDLDNLLSTFGTETTESETESATLPPKMSSRGGEKKIVKLDVRPKHDFFSDARRVEALMKIYGRPLAVLGRSATVGEESGMAPADFRGLSLFTVYAVEDLLLFEIDKYEMLHLGMGVINLAADNLIQRLQDVRKALQEQLGWARYRRRLLADVIYNRDLVKGKL